MRYDLHDLPPPVWPRLDDRQVARLNPTALRQYRESLGWTDAKRAEWWRRRDRKHRVDVGILLGMIVIIVVSAVISVVMVDVLGFGG